MRWLDKLKNGLKKTASKFSWTDVNVDTLEESLIMADIGIETTQELVSIVQGQHPKDAQEMRRMVRDALLKKIEPVVKPLVLPKTMPAVILMVGVNGAGKTTTIGKLAAQYISQRKKVACVAGDTFRAGAVEQLKQWTQKVGADFYAGKPGCDAAGLIYDSLNEAIKKETDVVFVDTAGRLQNRTDLMDELKKIIRVIKKVSADMPHEVILVLDATVGQNAISQVKTFKEICSVSGLIMTKLDGSAKGGVLVALASTFQLPIYAIGVGEHVDDLNAFSAEDYVDSLLGDE